MITRAISASIDTSHAADYIECGEPESPPPPVDTLHDISPEPRHTASVPVFDISRHASAGSQLLQIHGKPEPGKFSFGGKVVKDNAWRRFQACVLIGLGVSEAQACEFMQLDRQLFDKTNWYQRYVEDPQSVLSNKSHTRKRKICDAETDLIF